MPTARVNDINMYYELHGRGTPLVHVGGLAGDARAWARQIQWLSQHFQVLCFDNRGTGRSDCPDQRYSSNFFLNEAAFRRRYEERSRANVRRALERVKA